MMPDTESILSRSELWKTTAEKVFYSLQLSLQLEALHSGLSWLAKHRYKLPRRAEFHVWEAIEDDTTKLLKRLIVIAKRRRVEIKDLLGRVPSLLINATYRQWRKYILEAISVAEEAMDSMDLLLTGVAGESWWEEDFLDTVLDSEFTLVPFKKTEEE